MTFIGDRFIHAGPHWLDIVTGRAAVVRAGPAPADLTAREGRCEARWRVFGPGPRLIDFGPQGSMGWFEAESAAAVTTPARMRQLMWPQVRGVADAIGDAAAPGHLGIAAPPGAGFTVLCGQLARLARDAGFVTVRADAPIPFRLRRLLLHRHLVLLVASDAARAFAAGWLILR